ncbi:CobW family GTP-binding protein [Paenibacillus sp. y28]|uniref:CobW family GTP-binding protein n=1 Tax=Paenibacillus sp. y28 TaxID=3129110 RepID=UPI0030197FE5
MKRVIPIYILTGFLGSGKSTLLTKALDYYRHTGRRPAVIMNELGSVNLDGLLVDGSIPMEEVLSGCICCTSLGDLSMAIRNLIELHNPDVLFIEATGVANPLPLLDTVSDASLIVPVRIEQVITVIDGMQLLNHQRHGLDETQQLLEDQIRGGTLLLLNKADLLQEHELQEAERLIRTWNPHAVLQKTLYSTINFEQMEQASDEPVRSGRSPEDSRVWRPKHALPEPEHGASAPYHSYEHVAVHTVYVDQPVERAAFERMISRLPRHIYRAKGILRFADNGEEQFIFQYAYGDMQLYAIRPRATIADVLVFIGEHVSKLQLQSLLLPVLSRQRPPHLPRTLKRGSAKPV